MQKLFYEIPFLKVIILILELYFHNEFSIYQFNYGFSIIECIRASFGLLIMEGLSRK